MPHPVAAPYTIMERSPWSSLAVFLPVQGLPASYDRVIQQTAHHMHPVLDNALPTALIYLQADPETCLTRTQARQRPEETALTLAYLQKLHRQYDAEVNKFPGVTVTINANQDEETVYAAVKRAVELLHEAFELPLGHNDYYTLWSDLKTPYTVAEFPALTRLLGPDKLLTTCDPYLLRLYPDQLLACTEEMAHTPASSPDSPLPVTDSPPGEDKTTEPTPPSPLDLAPLDFLSGPSHLLYHKDSEVPVLFQGGPGNFGYSPLFQAEYEQRFSSPVDTSHRINNLHALDLYAALGPWLSSAPGANVLLAVAPKKALPALQVRQVNTDGTEVVYVDTEQYATFKAAEQEAQDPVKFNQTLLKSDITFPWTQAFTNEAYMLDSWIRLVRLRPTIPCGVSLHNPNTTTLEHGSVLPMGPEHYPKPEPALRLASCLPHQEKSSHPPTSPEQMNMYDRPQRKTAKLAIKHMKDWTTTEAQAVTSESKVPSDLPCSVCGSPHDWVNLLLCHRCDKGCQTYCVGLVGVLSGNWYCDECVLHGAPETLPLP
jgi:hypothetical protein